MDTLVTDKTPINDDMEPVDVKAVTPLNNPEMLAAGTMLTTDIVRARRFHEEYYGLECVRHRPDGLLVRDRGRQPDGHRNGGEYWVWEIIENDRVEFPQSRDHHWGADAISTTIGGRSNTRRNASSAITRLAVSARTASAKSILRKKSTNFGKRRPSIRINTAFRKYSRWSRRTAQDLRVSVISTAAAGSSIIAIARWDAGTTKSSNAATSFRPNPK